MADDKEVATFWRRNISVGSKITGGVAGALTSFATGNPFIGAALSPFIAHNLERFGHEVIDRQLTPRQEARVGRAFVIATSEIRDRLSNGEIIRSDDFFGEEGSDLRSSADEIGEAALSAAMGSTDEKKVDHIAFLLAVIAFNDTIDMETSRVLISTAESISFRSFCILAILKEPNTVELFRPDYVSPPGPMANIQAMKSEIYDLIGRGLIEMRESRSSETVMAVLGVDSIDPSHMYLTDFGALFHDSLQLHKIPHHEPISKKAFANLQAMAPSSAKEIVIDGGGALR